MKTLVSMLAATLLLLPGCGSETTAGAGKPTVLRAAVSTPADVQRVTLSAFGDTRSYAFELSPGAVPNQWSGGGDVLPGTYWVQADAYDPDGVVIFSGSAGPLLVELNQTTFVGTILAQSTIPPVPFENSAPRIHHVYVSSLELPLEGTSRVMVVATDRDPESVLTYAWSATGGWFDDPAVARTTFHAPASDAIVTVNVLVTDEHGSSARASFRVVVGNPVGALNADVMFNSHPEVTSVAAEPTLASPGEPVIVSATATDPDGDPLTYSWGSSGCYGWFSEPWSQSTTFTPYGSYMADGACDLYVSVSDGRGGWNGGMMTIWIGAPPQAIVLPTDFQNGSFETGDYTGWHLEQRQGTVVQPSVTQGIGASGDTLEWGEPALDYFTGWWKPQYSPGLPLTFTPNDGTFMAFTLHDAPYHYASNARLWQDLALPAAPEGGRLVLAWHMAYWNHHTEFVPPGTPPGPQRFAVQLLDIVTGERLATVFATQPGDPLSIPMTPFEVDLSAWAGQDLRINFVLNQTYDYLDLGLDDVRLYTAVP